MRMTYAEIGKSVDVLSKLHEQGELGYAVACNIKNMREVAKEYLTLRAELFLKYGELSDDKKSMTVSGENVKKFNDELGDLPKKEADIDIVTVDKKTFCSGNITSDQMTSLFWMVNTDPEKVEGEVV